MTPLERRLQAVELELANSRRAKNHLVRLTNDHEEQLRAAEALIAELREALQAARNQLAAAGGLTSHPGHLRQIRRGIDIADAVLAKAGGRTA